MGLDPIPQPGAFPATMTIAYLADGDAGAHFSVDSMRAAVDRALKSPQIYELARRIVQNVPPYDDAQEVKALYDWVHQNIRFVKGVSGKQSIQTADATLAMQAGQCTDMAILLAALVMSIGYPAGFRAIASDPGAPDQFNHIYPEVQLEGAWVPIDAARADASFGVPPARIYRSEFFSILDHVGNMPRLGDDSSVTSTTADIANVIAAAGNSAAQIIAANNAQPAYVLVNGQFVPNPNYAVQNGAQPVLQNTSQALGVPSLALLLGGGWLLYTLLKR
jgi:hypothetical protein